MSDEYYDFNQFSKSTKSKRRNRGPVERENRKIKTKPRQKDYHLIAKQVKQRERYDWIPEEIYERYSELD
ncbi:hypothetical protein NEF87_001323 [Candidatus Lokiarchaeum ossiferum]|uniref:Transposase n=1 Tax=Candidatus Lokiarchaeum ossiferum TaxID=2951803 RepID=A0ABY6HNE4_9ARCH|nr:hypothetical protein NEF87_001323 [Candidatus Lokiarchaeum sp. B-35]